MAIGGTLGRWESMLIGTLHAMKLRRTGINLLILDAWVLSATVFSKLLQPVAAATQPLAEPENAAAASACARSQRVREQSSFLRAA
jgi:hypothetical protein